MQSRGSLTARAISVSAFALAIASVSAADVPIFQYLDPIVVFANGRVSPVTYRLDWDAVCTDVMPACSGTGTYNDPLICYSNPSGKFKPSLGPGCEFTYYNSNIGYDQVFYQMWTYPYKWCPTGYAYQSDTGQCAKAQTYQGSQVCSDGNPVFAADGSKRQSETDFYYFAGGQSVDFTRVARTDSLSDFRSAAGWGWLFDRWGRSLNLRSVNTATKIIVASRGAGKAYALQPDANGTWKTTPFDGIEIRPNASGWILVDSRENLVEQYDASGVLQQFSNSSGLSFALSYSDSSTPVSIAPGSGFLITVTSNFGRAVNLTYDSSGRLATAAVSGASAATSYGYDAARPAVLVQVQYPDASRRGYVYDAATPGTEFAILASLTVPAGWASEADYNASRVASPYLQQQSLTGRRNPQPLTGIVDANASRFSTYRYDAQYRVASEFLGSGVSNYAFNYSAPLSQTIVTDPHGSASTRTYAVIGSQLRLLTQSQAAGAGCDASSANVGYDVNANRSSVDNFNGKRTCFAYVLTRNVETVRVEGLPNTANCAALTPPNVSLPAGSRKISTLWHPHWMLAAKVAEPGRVTTSVYHGQPDPFNGNIPAACAPPAALLPDGKPLAVLCKRVEQASTDTDGHLGFSAGLDAGVANRVYTWTYNQSGQVLTSVDPLNNTTTSAYYVDITADHAVGDLQRVTNALGAATNFLKYNKHGQVLESTDANGVLTVNTYDLRQRLLSTSVGGQITSYGYDAEGQFTRITRPDASYVGYEYDDAHRIKAVFDNRGNRIEYTLDDAGNRKVENAKDPGGALARQLTRGFDSLGRVQSVTGVERAP